MNIRDRIKELRRVRAGDLRPHPKNWRKHPVFFPLGHALGR
jgi:hypothetical protein